MALTTIWESPSTREFSINFFMNSSFISLASTQISPRAPFKFLADRPIDGQCLGTCFHLQLTDLLAHFSFGTVTEPLHHQELLIDVRMLLCSQDSPLLLQISRQCQQNSCRLMSINGTQRIANISLPTILLLKQTRQRRTPHALHPCRPTCNSATLLLRAHLQLLPFATGSLRSLLPLSSTTAGSLAHWLYGIEWLSF